jgi:hypothetical protein
MRLLFLKIKGEQGVSDLVTAGLLLPIALMLIVAAADFTRTPIVRDQLYGALVDASFRVDRRLGDLAAGGETKHFIDTFTPAGNALCSYIHSTNPCSDSYGWTGLQGFITAGSIGSYLGLACDIAVESFNSQQTNFLSIADGNEPEFSFQFYMLRLNLDSTTCVFEDIQLLEMVEDCKNTTGSFNSVVPPTGFSFDIIAEVLRVNFDASSSPSMGGWVIDNDSDVNGPYTSTAPRCLPSYWLVGVGYTKVDHLFKGFFGSSDLVIEYFVRPLNNPAGIQSADLNS